MGGGYEAPSASYAEPAAPSTGYGAPFSDVKGLDLLSPETSLVIGIAGLIAGMVAIAALVDQSNKVSSICTTTKALGDTSLTLSTSTNTATAALIAAQLNLIENKINSYATPSC